MTLPSWMTEEAPPYEPPKGGSAFAVKTLRSLSGILSRIRFQKGHEKRFHLPAEVKFPALIVLILLVSFTQNRLLLMGVAAPVLLYLATWPARDIGNILKSTVPAVILAGILFLPAMILRPAGIPNDLIVIGKVFLCVTMVAIFNHTSQWNHITRALRRFHIPAVFVFTIDLALKFIVVLGSRMEDLLTALLLRSVGRNQKKYQSVGGILGVTFLRGTELDRQMYEAMVCRGFTDDYKGL